MERVAHQVPHPQVPHPQAPPPQAHPAPQVHEQEPAQTQAAQPPPVQEPPEHTAEDHTTAVAQRDHSLLEAVHPAVSVQLVSYPSLVWGSSVAPGCTARTFTRILTLTASTTAVLWPTRRSRLIACVSSTASAVAMTRITTASWMTLLAMDRMPVSTAA